MPPEPHEYQGKAAIGDFLRGRSLWRGGRRLRLVPTSANGQPAFGYYMEDPNPGVARAVGILVLSVAPESIAATPAYCPTSDCLEIFRSTEADGIRRSFAWCHGVYILKRPTLFEEDV